MQTATQTVTQTVEYSIEELKAMVNPGNPRWMPEDQMASLVQSLTQFDQVEPLIVNTRTKRIVGGHQRVSAAEAAGLTTLAAVVVDLSPEEEITLNLALNKVKGYWNYEQLAKVLAELPADTLVATGFSQVEVDSIITAYPPNAEEIAANATAIEGVVETVRNRTEQEARAIVEDNVRVQFGQFNRRMPAADYQAWVQMLITKSQHGTSPAALGAVVAQMLGLAVREEVTDGTGIEMELDGEADPIVSGDEDEDELF